MDTQPSSGGNLLDTLRGAASSLAGGLSQLATRKKSPDKPPAPTVPRLAPEGPRWGPLVLLDRVGEGAFGEVYRAWDVTLEREVALKLMRAAAEDPALLQEARMLARLRHPNVVTVYGADRHDGRSGVWMDFIEGDTLGAIVEDRGSFGPLEALLVGVDVCRALAAVHQSGLLHRDIKAQNVMRERGGRIVLMDFGLGHETAAGAPSDLGGTPLYMAPELLEGAPASVRSDLYATGVLLFHLVTGAFPIRGSSLDELRARHAAREPQTLRDLRSDLPSSFVRAVEKAVAHQPSQRYATAGQMTAALEAAMGTRTLSPGLTRRVFWWTAPPAAAAAAGGWYWWMRPSAKVSEGAGLLLTEIANATGDPQLDAVIDVLRVQMAQSAHFNLLGAERIGQMLARMKLPPDQKLEPTVARDVAWRSGTPLVVYGTLSPLGAGYGLGMVMERIAGQPKNPEATVSKLFEARSKSGLFDAIHQAATWIRQTAGEAAKDISAADTQPEEATTSSWNALEYFTRGERLRDRGQTPDAVSMYQIAVRIDPTFAIALARIAQGEAERRHPAEAFAYWRKAVDALTPGHATRREELRIRGLYASETEDFAAAEDLTHGWALLYRKDPLAHHYRALALRNLERLEEARQELLTAQELQPDPRHLTNLVIVSLLLGHRDETAKYLKDLDGPRAAYCSGLAKFLETDFDGAERAFDSVIQSSNERLRSLAFSAGACLLAELGRIGDARKLLEDGAAKDAAAANYPGRARKLLAMGHLDMLNGQTDRTRALAQEAARLYPDTEILLRAGRLLAHAGFSADGRRMLEQIHSDAEGRRSESAHAILSAALAAAGGRMQEALDGLGRADRLVAPLHARDFLADGFDRLGNVEDALRLYQRIASRPALVWFYLPETYEPGLWTASLLRTAALSFRAGRRQESRAALDQFLKIRQSADAGHPETVAAHKLLSAF